MNRNEITPQFQLAALTVLKDAVEARIEALRQDIFANIDNLNKLHGVKAIDVKADEQALASITLTERKQSFYVNEEEFVNWVQENYPDEIVITKAIREGMRKQILENAIVTEDGLVVSGATGEIIEGLAPKAITKTIALRFKPDGRNKVADILAQGRTNINELFGNQLKQIEE